MEATCICTEPSPFWLDEAMTLFSPASDQRLMLERWPYAANSTRLQYCKVTLPLNANGCVLMNPIKGSVTLLPWMGSNALPSIPIRTAPRPAVHLQQRGQVSRAAGGETRAGGGVRVSAGSGKADGSRAAHATAHLNLLRQALGCIGGARRRDGASRASDAAVLGRRRVEPGRTRRHAHAAVRGRQRGGTRAGGADGAVESAGDVANLAAAVRERESGKWGREGRVSERWPRGRRGCNGEVRRRTVPAMSGR